MSVKFIQNQDLGKLEKLVNKELAKGELRLHSLTQGGGMFIAVLESAPKPASRPTAKSAEKPSGAKSKR